MKQTQKKRKKKQYKKWPWVAAILALLVIAVVVFAGARLAAEKSKVHAFICGKVRSIYSGHRGTIPSAWRMHLMRAAAHMSAKPRPGIFALSLKPAQSSGWSISGYDLYGAPARGREAGKEF